MAEIRQKPMVVMETTEAQIAVHWREEEYYYPSAKFVGQANLTNPDVIDRFSEENFPECFREYADLLSWDQYWHTTLDTSDPPFWKWFVGGKINASYNCVDRHLAKYKNKAALIFVPDPEMQSARWQRAMPITVLRMPDHWCSRAPTITFQSNWLQWCTRARLRRFFAPRNRG